MYCEALRVPWRQGTVFYNKSLLVWSSTLFSLGRQVDTMRWKTQTEHQSQPEIPRGPVWRINHGITHYVHTADHMLQTCPMYAAARDNIWPSPTSFGEETLRFTGGSSFNGCIHPRDWVGHLNRDERRRIMIMIMIMITIIMIVVIIIIIVVIIMCPIRVALRHMPLF